MPVIAEMLNLTTDIYKKNNSSRTADILTEASGPKNAGLTRGRDLFQLNVNYRWSEIVFDERFAVGDAQKQAYGSAGQEVRAGDRAPDAPALECLFPAPGVGIKAPSCLFDVFDPTRHIALVFRGALNGEALPLHDSLEEFPSGAMLKVLILPPGGEYEPLANSLVDYVVRDTMGHAYGGYGLDMLSPSSAAVIVRPDSYVGAFATSPAGIDKYRSLILN